MAPKGLLTHRLITGSYAFIAMSCTMTAADHSHQPHHRRHKRHSRKQRNLEINSNSTSTNKETIAIKERELSSAAATFSTSRRKAAYFKMRMYWQRGYYWQESSSERFWCMKCSRGDCGRGSRIKIDKCSNSDSRQQWFFSSGRIRSRMNKSQCIERIEGGRYLALSTCDNSRHQKWDQLVKDKPFQLRLPGKDEKCMSQHHHPKKDEELYMTSCKKSSRNRTDKWIVY